MIKTLHYQIELNDDVILSATSASVERQSLDYIPGNTLLGIMAARGYSTFSPEEAFALFHSGQVRFCNAYIENTLPLPLCLHRVKGSEYQNSQGVMNQSQVFNLSQASTQFPQGEKQQQLSKGYIDKHLKHYQPLLGHRLKTAIDPFTGRAETSQLFSYQHLLKGQIFTGRVVFDAGNQQQYFMQKVKQKLTGELRLGRSKSSEYGRAVLTWLDNSEQVPSLPEQEQTDQLLIWCLSDCALSDPHSGQTSLQLIPQHVFPKSLEIAAAIKAEHTFIRSRRYIPYNTYRGGHEMERQVISRGSVICFQLTKTIDWNTLKTIQSKGIGLYREQGLGQIAINHPWLMADYKAPIDKPIYKKTIANHKSAADTVPVPENSRLCQWLEQFKSNHSRLESELKILRRNLKEFYRCGRNFNGVDGQDIFGLSTTQWGNLYDLAKQHRTITDLKKALFDPENGLCKSEDDEWGVACNDNNQTFADWLQETIVNLHLNSHLNSQASTLTERDISLLFTRLARQMRNENDDWLNGHILSIDEKELAE